MPPVLTDLATAAALVKDGDLVALGGHTRAAPMALIRELIDRPHELPVAPFPHAVPVLTRLAQEVPLVISDIQMPQMNGIDFAKALMAIDADTIHLRIDSPGGEIFAGQSMAQAILASDETIQKNPQLIQKLVTSDPTPAYVARVAAVFATSTPLAVRCAAHRSNASTTSARLRTCSIVGR